MKNLIAPAFAMLLALAASGQATATTIEYDGHQRSFEMYVPPTAPRPLPIVLVLHGGKGNSTLIRSHTQFDTVATRENVLAVYPQALAGLWNDGRKPTADIGRKRTSDSDDTGFLLAIADSLIERGLADPRRLFVAGLSNGGMMALRLACEHPERIAGVAVVSASQPENIDCAPSRAVPIILFHGTADRFIPFKGGDILQWSGVDRGRVLSADDTVDQWREINGCTGAPQTAHLSSERRVSVDKITYQPCSGAPVEHVVLRGGGHTWPGGKLNAAGERLLGPSTTAIDASEEIWNFFKAQPGR